MCQILVQDGKTFRFKVDTGACGNLLPYNLYKWIVENKANMNYLHRTIDNSMNLVAYNNKKDQAIGYMHFASFMWCKHKDGEILYCKFQIQSYHWSG